MSILSNTTEWNTWIASITNRNLENLWPASRLCVIKGWGPIITEWWSTILTKTSINIWNNRKKNRNYNKINNFWTSKLRRIYRNKRISKKVLPLISLAMKSGHIFRDNIHYKKWIIIKAYIKTKHQNLVTAIWILIKHYNAKHNLKETWITFKSSFKFKITSPLTWQKDPLLVCVKACNYVIRLINLNE